MSTGAIDATGNFPSDDGLPLGRGDLLGSTSHAKSLVVLTLEGTLGSSPAGKVQVNLKDDDVDQWVDVGTTLTAAGQVVVEVAGEAVRANVNPGSGYTTNQAFYTLNKYPLPIQ